MSLRHPVLHLVVLSLFSASVSTVWADEPELIGLASTVSAETACQRLKSFVLTLDESPHKYTMASAAGFLVGAGLATRGTLMERAASRKLLQEGVIQAARTQIEGVLKKAATEVERQGMRAIAELASSGGFSVEGRVFSTVQELVASPEFRTHLSKTLSRSAVNQLTQGPQLLGSMLDVYLQELSTRFAGADAARLIARVNQTCLSTPSLCARELKLLGHYMGSIRNVAEHAGRQALDQLIAALSVEPLSKEARLRAFLKMHSGSELRSAGRGMMWAGAILGVIAELLRSAPADGAPKQVIAQDPSLLLTSYRENACAYLADDPLLREKTLLMIDAVEEAEQARLYGDDVMCDGEHDLAGREHAISEMSDPR